MSLTRRQYWRDRAVWARQRSKLWTWEKLISGLAVGVAGCFFQWWFGLRLTYQTFQFILTLLLGYGVVALFQFLGNWLLTAPAALEERRLIEIATLTDENEKYKNPETLVTLQFETMHFNPLTGSVAPNIVVNLKVLNRGQATTLHGIRLCSDTDPTVRFSPSRNSFVERQPVSDSVRLESGDVRTGFLQFQGAQTRQVWVLEFSDANNKPHREPIPVRLYEPNF